ncbi:MAG TPA: P1 family peptidase [Actinomycetota bacterium]|nr:P1 family peptidase [Actinomycetota bacterium]
MIADVPGVRVGHWTNTEALTGCTVILMPNGTTGSVVVPGGAPATRETDAISPGRRVDEVNAVLLTGGSAFGLGAADGVMRYLEERGIGHPTPAGVVPIVPTAAIFDLGFGSSSVRPGPDEGYAACVAASEAEGREGNIGAGMGATVGKGAGFENASKGGVGNASARDGSLIVGAIAVVNAVGDIVDDDGRVIAGARAEPWPLPPILGTNTTIACIVSNAVMTKEECHRAAEMATAGLARAIRPVHTMFDGDVVFLLATRAVPSYVEIVGRLAADVLAAAVRRAVRAASDVAGIPARGHR